MTPNEVGRRIVPQVQRELGERHGPPALCGTIADRIEIHEWIVVVPVSRETVLVQQPVQVRHLRIADDRWEASHPVAAASSMAEMAAAVMPSRGSQGRDSGRVRQDDPLRHCLTSHLPGTSGFLGRVRPPRRGADSRFARSKSAHST